MTNRDVLIQAVEGFDDVTIQGDDIVIEAIEGLDDVTIEGLIRGIESGEIVNIEGFFSFIKKAVRKVASVGKIANKFGLLPPGAGFGLNMLSKLASSPRTRNRVKFSAGATKNVYTVAYLKGYGAALLKIENITRRLRRR